MKIKIIIKEPDALVYEIAQAIREANLPALTFEELELVRARRGEIIKKQIESRWVKYGEYFGIEFDTDAGTARVLEVDEWE